MKKPWQEFSVPVGIKEILSKRLAPKKEFFSFESDPLLASLVSCLGLQFEMGRSGWDRLSSLLGVSLENNSLNPWNSEIISLRDEIGLRLWLKDGQELHPTHPDLGAVLHPLSLNEEGKLYQLVIFPARIARFFKATRNLNLVIVRDWVLSSFLSPESESLNYQQANSYEMDTNIAKLQIELMLQNSVSFSGTHDLVDHLLGGNGKNFTERKNLFETLKLSYEFLFPPNSQPKRNMLALSYLVAIVLDDMAQPAWYNSKNHEWVVKSSLVLLHELSNSSYDIASLHELAVEQLVNNLRQAPAVSNLVIQAIFEDLKRCLQDSGNTTTRPCDYS